MELLRIAMDAKQVQEACEEWARDRSSLDGAKFNVRATLQTPAGTALVVFTKKRERKAKDWKPGDGA